MKKVAFASIAVTAAIILSSLLWPHQTLAPTATQNTRATVSLGDTSVSADIADTPELRERGLSGRSGLAESEGMLFIFQEDGYHAFWMKDMLFAIDMIWIAPDKRVVYIAANATPESYPESFAADGPSRYVLEVPAGFAARHGIAEGSVVSF